MTARPRYNPVTPAILDELRVIVGERFVITDAEKMEPYSHDEVSDRTPIRLPEVVVKPRTAEEISAILKLANRALIPVTPRGAGSGLSGGASPIRSGILLSVERMNAILEIDVDNLMITVEPGVVTNNINEALKPHGLFYAGYPMSVETCFVGGNVAENAGGGRAIKYGVTERYVLGLEIVMPTGEICTFGGKRIKDVTGYNMRKFFVGSEGTLGVITRVILKLLPTPKATMNLLALFADTGTAIATVLRVMNHSGVLPTTVEYMDQASVRTACEYLNENLPYEQCGAMLLIEVDGNSEERVWSDGETIGELCVQQGAQEVYVADNRTTRERLWNVRRNIAEAMIATSPHMGHEDIVVPPAAIPRFVRAVEELAVKHRVPASTYGHAGDGNLHVRIGKYSDDDLAEWQRRLEQALLDLYAVTRDLGGTISGEHGIGWKHARHMRLFATDAELAVQRRIKDALDPKHILNPGKVLEE